MPMAEIKLWQHLKGKQFLGLKFRRQYGIGQYIVDFYCPEKKFAIEVDGATHLKMKRKRIDHIRDAFIRSLNIQIFRYTNLDISENIDGVLEDLRMRIESMAENDNQL